MPLPTEKTPPTLTPEQAKTLIYGPPGIGKTTFAVGIDPDHTLLLATEPGTGAVEAFVEPVNSWEEFCRVGRELREDEHPFTTIAVDTADVLADLCSAYVMVQNGIKHPSDLEWGKGWQMVADEFQLRVARLCSLGLGVCFISHAKQEEIKRSNGVGTYTRQVPALSTSARRFLTGFVDFEFYATTDDDGTRVIRTQPNEGWEVKSRLPEGADPLPDPLPLRAAAVREAITNALAAPAATE